MLRTTTGRRKEPHHNTKIGQVSAAAALVLALDVAGWLNIYDGDPELPIGRLSSAMRLGPLDPILFGIQGGMACAHFFCRTL